MFFVCLGIKSGSYHSQFSPMNITAEEQAGLEAVLHLTATVVEKVDTDLAICMPHIQYEPVLVITLTLDTVPL